MIKRYCLHLLNSNKTLIGIYNFICFILFPLLILLEGDIAYKEWSIIGYYIYIVISIIGISVLPLLSYNFNYSKRSVDIYYSLPIKRIHLFLIHYIIPLLCLFIPIILYYTLGLFLLNIHTIVPITYILEQVFRLIIILITLTASYSLIIFFIQKCNTLLDATLISLCVNFIPFIIYGASYSLIQKFLVPTGVRIGDLLDFILYTLSPIYNGFLMLDFDLSNIDMKSLYILIYMIIINIIFLYLGIKAFNKRKGEDASQITHHILTYPLMINIFIICIMSFIDFINFDSITFLILCLSMIFIVYLVLTFIANRKVEINIKIILRYFTYIIFLVVLSVISRETDCFSLNNSLVTKPFETVYVEASYYNEEKEEYLIYEQTYNLSDQDKINELQELQLLASEQYYNDQYCNNLNYPVYIVVQYAKNSINVETRDYTFDKHYVEHILDDLVLYGDEYIKD